MGVGQDTLVADKKMAITMADSIAANQGLIADGVVITTVRASLETILTEEPLWYVVYFAHELPPPYLLMTINPTTGESVEIDKGNYLSQREKWEAVLGPERGWSLEDKATFGRIFFESQLFGARVPESHHLSQEDAKAIAYDALRKNVKNLSEDAMLRLEIGFLFRSDIVQRGDGCGWMVAFYPKGQQGGSPKYQVNIAADNGEVVLFYPDPANHG